MSISISNTYRLSGGREVTIIDIVSEQEDAILPGFIYLGNNGELYNQKGLTKNHQNKFNDIIPEAKGQTLYREIMF